MNIAVFTSNNGSNLQAIINACELGTIDAKVCVVLSDNATSKALKIARSSGITGFCINKKLYEDSEFMNEEILNTLSFFKTDFIFLAGYLKKIDSSILREYNNKIFNIHPSLLPKYGGKGMYGMNVHEAVIKALEKVSGVTIHRVSENYDEGEIVAQTIVNISENETAETLSKKILEREHTFIIEVIKDIINGVIPLNNIKQRKLY